MVFPAEFLFHCTIFLVYITQHVRSSIFNEAERPVIVAAARSWRHKTPYLRYWEAESRQDRATLRPPSLTGRLKLVFSLEEPS